MSKITPISGFGEFLPAEQKLFTRMMDIIRKHFERYGYVQIETPAVERVDTLLSKGGNDKEIYALRRLAAQEGESDEKDLALHFDLTVPLARYVAQHYGQLVFPFKRFQMQPVWRGERPQAGRYRQFYQCDIDVIGDTTLPLLYDAEVPTVMYRIFSEMNIGRFVIRLNNRKALQGALQHFGVAEGKIGATIAVIDDMEKVPAEKTRERLAEMTDQADALLAFFAQKLDKDAWLEAFGKLDNAMVAEGVAELRDVVAAMRHMGVVDDAFVVDPTIARGLDYYTGTVYETKLVDHPAIGSICSGGRYEDLAGKFSNKKLPGVGMSIGLTRLVPQLVKAGVLQVEPTVGADVLVTLMDASHIGHTLQMAEDLRAQGITVEAVLEARKFDKQMKYADRKGAKVVVIVGGDEIENGTVTLKDMRRSQQQNCPREALVATVQALLA